MSTKDELLNSMKKKPSTNNWDIVCCYNEDIINDLLKEKYAQGKLVTSVNISGSYEDAFMGTILVEVKLSLHEPELQFVFNTQNMSQLSMPINGGTCKLTPKDFPDKAKEFPITPNVLKLIAMVPLASTSGDTKIHDGTYPIIFDAGSTCKQQVFLHFSNETGTTFDIIPMQGKEEDARKEIIYQENIQPEIIRLIATYFKKNVSEIEYAMGGISNETQVGVKTILPKSFIFAVSKPSENSFSCLNLYIQTTDSGKPPGDRSPSFQPSGSAISPIPDGYTASLILSNDYTKTLLTSLMADKNGVFDSTVDGILVPCYLPKKITYPGYYRDANHWFKGINIDISNTPLYINLNQDTQSISISSPSAKGNYYNYDNCSQYPSGGAGYITASFTASKSFQLKLTQECMLQFDFDLNSSYISTDIKNTTTSGGWQMDEKDIVDGLKRNIPEQVGNVSVKMNQVNMFVVSNLLFPEKHIFKFLPGDSFYVPHDMIIFGNIGK